MNNIPRIFLVDDQPAVLKAISRLLGLAGFKTTCFESAQDFLNSGCTTQPGCLILDSSMPEMNGIALQNELTKLGSKLPIIFLTGNGDIDTSVQAMKSGAADFLTKPVQSARLLTAVRDACEKNKRILLNEIEINDIRQRLASLTPRENDVLNLIITGKLNKQIADELSISIQTVKIHRARVMTKMKIKSVAGLVHLMERASHQYIATPADSEFSAV